MSNKYLNVVRILLPGVAVLIGFLAVFAGPANRQRRQALSEIPKEQAIENELNRKLHVLQTKAGEERRNEAMLTAPVAQTAKQGLGEVEDSSSVDVFAQLLAIFESYGVKCVEVDTVDVDGENHLVDHDARRVSLEGDFNSVLSALEAVEVGLPQVLAETLSMQRKSPVDSCQWKLVFRFQERS